MTDFPASEAVEILNPSGAGEFVIVCEHASRFIPRDLHDLGLSKNQLCSHIAWDAGALEVARVMSVELDAPLIAAKISRLVYDCNRAQGVESAVVAKSDGVSIPGNSGLSRTGVRGRYERVYQPFFETLKGCLEDRDQRGQKSAIVTVHSFTPIMNGIKRYLDLGVLHDADRRLADRFLAVAQEGGNLRVRLNEPYGADDDVTHTLVEHGVSKGRLNIMLEIRNDLLKDTAAQTLFGERLAQWVLRAREKLTVE